MPRKKAVKKAVKKKTAKKTSGRSVRKSQRSVAKKTTPKKQMVKAKRVNQNKFPIVVKNLILFAIIFIFSIVLYSVTTNALLKDFFWILSLLSGVVAAAFFIILLILAIMRVSK